MKKPRHSDVSLGDTGFGLLIQDADQCVREWSPKVASKSLLCPRLFILFIYLFFEHLSECFIFFILFYF